METKAGFLRRRLPGTCRGGRPYFCRKRKHAQVVVEIEVGENRSGIIEEDKFFELLDSIKRQKTYFLGIFSHEGHCYNAETMDDCHEKFIVSQRTYPSLCPIGKRTWNGVQTCEHRQHQAFCII